MSVPENQEIDYRARIKPADKVSITTTKIVSAFAFSAGLCTTGLGLYVFAKGQRSNVQQMKTAGAIVGTSGIIVGGITALVGAAGLKTAKAAKNARDFVNTAEAAQNFMTQTPIQQKNLSELNAKVQEKEAATGQRR